MIHSDWSIQVQPMNRESVGMKLKHLKHLFDQKHFQLQFDTRHDTDGSDWTTTALIGRMNVRLDVVPKCNILMVDHVLAWARANKAWANLFGFVRNYYVIHF